MGVEDFPDRENGNWYQDPVARVRFLYDSSLSPAELRAQLQKETFVIYQKTPLLQSLNQLAQYYGRLQAIKRLSSGDEIDTRHYEERSAKAFITGAVVVMDGVVPLLPQELHQKIYRGCISITMPKTTYYSEEEMNYDLFDSIDAVCDSFDSMDINDQLFEFLDVGTALFADQPQPYDDELSYQRGVIASAVTIMDIVHAYEA